MGFQAFKSGTFIIIWKFRPQPDHQAQFRQEYGSMGSWVQLFQKSAGYLGSALLQDEADPGCYLTVDRWESEAAYNEFMVQHQEAYQALDRRFENLTESEEPVGRFTVL